MELKKGTPVYSARGKHLGEVARVVLDPRTLEVLDLVVTSGLFYPHAKVVPMSAVATANAERINLEDIDLDALTPFEIKHRVPADSEIFPGEGLEWPLFYSGTAIGLPPEPGSLPVMARTVVDRTIPEEAVALDTGAGVITSDGEVAGTVEEVLTDDAGRATSLVVSAGAFRGTRRAIPLSWAARIGEEEVRLAVPLEAFEELPVFETAA